MRLSFRGLTYYHAETAIFKKLNQVAGHLVATLMALN